MTHNNMNPSVRVLIMSIYITAQLVGFLGYLLLTRAPYSKDKHNIIKTEILACAFLSIQWFLLQQPGLLVMNFMNISLSYCALKAMHDPRIDRAMPLFYPIGIIVLLSSPGGLVINLLCALGFLAMVTARKSQDMRTFREFSMLAALVFVTCGIFASSIPAITFNLLFFSIHAYRLWGMYELEPSRALNIKTILFSIRNIKTTQAPQPIQQQ